MSSQAATSRFLAPLRRSRSLSRATWLVAHGALLGLLGCGVLIALAAAGGDSFLISTPPGRFPAWISGPLGGLAGTIGRPEFLTLVLLMWFAYAVVILTSGRVRPALALSVVAAAHLTFLLAPPLMSTDVFSYVDYGRLGAIHGLNPYLHTPLAAPHEAVYPLVGEKWRHTATAYGPLFTLITYPLAHLSLPAAVWALKGLSALASAGRSPSRPSSRAQRQTRTTQPALLVGLNPMLLVYAVGGGHNDLLMVALMLAAVALTLAGRERVAGIGLLAAATIKAPAVVVLPFLALGSRRPRRLLAGAAVGLAASMAVSALAFDGQAWRFLDVLRGQQSLVGADSLPHVLARLFGVQNAVPVTAIAHAALATTAIALLVAVRRGADWLAASGWLLLMLVVTTSFPLPWYTVWALALAAIGADRRLLAATLFVQALFFAHQLGPLLAS